MKSGIGAGLFNYSKRCYETCMKYTHTKRHGKKRSTPIFVPGAIYKIRCIDTYCYAGWHTEEEIDERTGKSETATIGFFVKETPLFVILCMTMETKCKDFFPYNTVKWIPTGTIVSVEKI